LRIFLNWDKNRSNMALEKMMGAGLHHITSHFEN
jgi:hypothetical protein